MVRRVLLAALLAFQGMLPAGAAAPAASAVPPAAAALQAVPGAEEVLPEGPPLLDGVPYLELRGTRVRVWCVPADTLMGARVLEVLEGQAPLPGLPAGVPRGVVAVVAHTPRAFDEAAGGAVPEWRAGVALPARSLMVLPSGEGRRLLDPEGRRTLRHEWAHLGLHQAVEGLRIPRWFDEGYAQWASGGWDAGDSWRLRVLLAMGRAPELDSLTLAWPRERAEAETAYLLAASAVTYLVGESGARGVELLVERWREQASFETALRATFGVTSGQFEEHWRRHVRQRYGWLFVLSRSAVFWMALALALLFMARARQGRNRERMARLRAAELPDQPAYWDAPGAGPAEEGGPAEPEGGGPGDPRGTEG